MLLDRQHSTGHESFAQGVFHDWLVQIVQSCFQLQCHYFSLWCMCDVLTTEYTELVHCYRLESALSCPNVEQKCLFKRYLRTRRTRCGSVDIHLVRGTIFRLEDLGISLGIDVFCRTLLL
jgi:hypothetical protein